MYSLLENIDIVSMQHMENEKDVITKIVNVEEMT